MTEGKITLGEELERLAQLGVKSITLEAVVTRADGTVEDLGVVSEYHAPEPPETPA